MAKNAANIRPMHAVELLMRLDFARIRREQAKKVRRNIFFIITDFGGEHNG
jgi:hypothetical protein